jgi:hypothetical protein
MLKNYYKTTPRKWRKIGDALLASAAIVGAGGLMAFDDLKTVYSSKELKIIIGITLFIGITGKFLTNFFKDEEK